MTVLLFGPLRELIGATSLDIPPAATAAEVKQHAAAARPDAAALIARCAVAADGQYVTGNDPVAGEIALIPPVSGGMKSQRDDVWFTEECDWLLKIAFAIAGLGVLLVSIASLVVKLERWEGYRDYNVLLFALYIGAALGLAGMSLASAALIIAFVKMRRSN